MTDALAIQERVLPHNLEAERSILGAILIHNDAYEAAAENVRSADFYRDAHARIFEAMAGLINDRRVNVDYVTLKEELGRRGWLEDVGGPAFIASLTDGVPRSTNVAHYAGIVQEKSTLRGLIYAANKVLTGAYEADRPASTLLNEADIQLLDLQRHGRRSRLVDLRATLGELFKDIEYRAEHRGELTGVDTGFKSVNDLTFGWQAGDLNIIAARPSIGKTAFCLNTAAAAARAGKRVAFFSLEMRRKQLEFRLLASLADIELTRIMSGFLGAADYPKLAAGMEAMHTLAIYIDDRAGQNVADIRSACRRLKADQGLDLVIIDYVQLMPGSLERRGATRNEEVTDISRRIKALADEISAPIHLLSQLNRSAKDRTDKRPQLEDLRESGSLEQDADIVAFLHRKNHQASGTTEFIVRKQRNGPTGTVNLTINRDTQTFTDGGEPEPEPAPKEKKKKVDGKVRDAG